MATGILRSGVELGVSLERMLTASGFAAPVMHAVPHMPTSIVVAERSGGET